MSAVSRKPASTQNLAVPLVVLLIAVAWGFSWTVAAWMRTSQWEWVFPLAEKFTLRGWSVEQSIFLGVASLVAVGLGVLASEPWKWGAPTLDRAAPYMAGNDRNYVLGAGYVRATHKRLGLNPNQHPGVVLGVSVATGRPLTASYESTLTMIAGPRRDKSAGVVIPNVFLAPGVCMTTSVKPDVVDVTLGYRSTVGPVYIFDPESMLADPVARNFAVWWNPLRAAVTVEEAAELANVLIASYTPDDRQDFFPAEGKRLLSDYLFAAAMSGQYLPTVAAWLQTDNSQEPINVLRETWPEIAARIEAAQNVTERTRSGIFSYARGAVAFLASPTIRMWCTPASGRAEFIPQRMFDDNAGTLYLLSHEGAVSAGPLVSALTKHVLDVAERHAVKQPGGRLRVPMLPILDEAGNVVRIPDLPERYSHYGSRGINPIVILQSEEQGERTWPNGGFSRLWGASTVQIFGGGNASASFLSNLSTVIGDYEFTDSSTTGVGSTRQTSTSTRFERILTESDLRSAERGRMIILPSGGRPVLAKTKNWFTDRKMQKKAKTPVRTNQ